MVKRPHTYKAKRGTMRKHKNKPTIKCFEKPTKNVYLLVWLSLQQSFFCSAKSGMKISLCCPRSEVFLLNVGRRERESDAAMCFSPQFFCLFISSLWDQYLFLFIFSTARMLMNREKPAPNVPLIKLSSFHLNSALCAGTQSKISIWIISLHFSFSPLLWVELNRHEKLVKKIKLQEIEIKIFLSN